MELKDFGGGCPWRLAAVYFDLTFPGRERAEVTLAAPDREYLTLLIDSDAFEDNATPGFLLNPRTQVLLQLDRFYPPSAAFAHEGPQYYRATARFPPELVSEQRERDSIKMGICMEREITLVVVRPEDLTNAKMRQKVANLLPLRDLAGYGMLIDYLESESHEYRRWIEGI